MKGDEKLPADYHTTQVQSVVQSHFTYEPMRLSLQKIKITSIKFIFTQLTKMKIVDSSVS